MKKDTGAPLEVTKETVRRYLEGEITIGLYAIHPSMQRCKWVEIDADYRNAMEDLLKLQYHLCQDGVESASYSYLYAIRSCDFGLLT